MASQARLPVQTPAVHEGLHRPPTGLSEDVSYSVRAGCEGWTASDHSAEETLASVDRVQKTTKLRLGLERKRCLMKR